MKALILVSLSVFLFWAPAPAVTAADLTNAQLSLSEWSPPPAQVVVDVPVTQEIRAWFSHHQVDGNSIDSAVLPLSVKLAMERVLVDGDRHESLWAFNVHQVPGENQKALEKLIYKALASGNGEARMKIGDWVWSLRT